MRRRRRERPQSGDKPQIVDVEINADFFLTTASSASIPNAKGRADNPKRESGEVLSIGGFLPCPTSTSLKSASFSNL